VLAYIRRCGYGGSDAEDLTQAFFLRFIERGWYADADPERGRFRSLLLTSLRRFLNERNAHDHAIKRGGGQVAVADMLDRVASDEETPEQAFVRAWLGTVLAHAMMRLESEWDRAGKREQFALLAPLLVERADSAELHSVAQALNQRSNTVAVQTHRMRQRLRQLVRLELLQTVEGQQDLEKELYELRGVLDETL
jgi:RNA polymerase sigma-70 factor (ECF subfamily)